MNDQSQKVIDSLVAGRKSSNLPTSTGPVGSVPKQTKSVRSDTPTPGGSWLILKCVIWAFAITVVAWLLTIPACIEGETAYVWVVCVPLYLTVFMPGNLLLNAMNGQTSVRSFGSVECVVMTLLVNSVLGFGVGLLVQGLVHLRRNITSGFKGTAAHDPHRSKQA